MNHSLIFDYYYSQLEIAFYSSFHYFQSDPYIEQESLRYFIRYTKKLRYLLWKARDATQDETFNSIYQSVHASLYSKLKKLIRKYHIESHTKQMRESQEILQETHTMI